MGITVAPVGAWPLAWIALAPFWVLVVSHAKPEKYSLPLLPYLSKCTEAKFRVSTPCPPLPLLSLLWAIGYHGTALWWITGVHPMTWMGVPWLASLAIALFCWIFITLWGAALVATWAAIIALLCRTKLQSWSRILIGVALWCALESLWSQGPLWWTSLSYTQSPHNLAILHLGQLSGPTTVTAAIVAINGLLAEAWLSPPSPPHPSALSVPLRFVPHPHLSLAATLLISLHLIGFALYTQPLTQPPNTALKVGIIQGNIPNTIKLYPEGFRRAIEGYTTGYRTLADQGVEAVLTPEGALPFLWADVMNTSLYSSVREKGVTAWIGAFGERGSSYTNSLITLTGNGKVFSRYDKVKLVPLGEYIPFEQVLGSLIDRLSPLEAHQVAGVPNQVFDTPMGRAIASICYESAFAWYLRHQTANGGQFILSAANNAHYSPAMPAQHHAQDVMRAIESDRWAVRATNTGYSGIVDPHGRTKWISQLNTYELHAATIYKRQTQTLYVRWGDWLMPVLLVLGAILTFSQGIRSWFWGSASASRASCKSR